MITEIAIATLATLGFVTWCALKYSASVSGAVEAPPDKSPGEPPGEPSGGPPSKPSGEPSRAAAGYRLYNTVIDRKAHAIVCPVCTHEPVSLGRCCLCSEMEHPHFHFVCPRCGMKGHTGGAMSDT